MRVCREREAQVLQGEVDRVVDVSAPAISTLRSHKATGHRPQATTPKCQPLKARAADNVGHTVLYETVNDVGCRGLGRLTSAPAFSKALTRLAAPLPPPPPSSPPSSPASPPPAPASVWGSGERGSLAASLFVDPPSPPSPGFRVQGPGSRVQGSGFKHGAD